MKKIKKLLIGIIGTITIWVFYYAVWISFFKFIYIRGFDFDFEMILPSFVFFFTTLLASIMTIWVAVILIPDFVFEYLEKRNIKKELMKKTKSNKKEKEF